MTQFAEWDEEAVEKLDVGRFIETHQGAIFDKLEKSDSHHTKDHQGDLMFIAENLPLMSAIINVGSTIETFKNAKDWVNKPKLDGGLELIGADPISILSALTFRYVARKGYELSKTSGEKEKIEIWQRICKRTKMLISEEEKKAAC
jgi:hypothetical protein